ncbi:MAG: mismatch-specific DNA-glycosylase [Chloroflexi bacterium]|nr:mismatch-specific DNA-glycosylase [Chloroflexota bacterium]
MREWILPDVLETGLRVVFCGTAAGPRSAQKIAYYAGPGNLFWETLYRVGLTPYRLQPEQYREVTRYGIGLTNIAQYVIGLDKDLSKADFDPEALRQKMLIYQPRVLAFNGKKAAAVLLGRGTQTVPYGLQPETIGETRLWVLPSTSGAARGFWDESWWRALAEYLLGEA